MKIEYICNAYPEKRNIINKIDDASIEYVYRDRKLNDLFFLAHKIKTKLFRKKGNDWNTQTLYRPIIVGGALLTPLIRSFLCLYGGVIRNGV